ncbi:MAG: GNAT family N-acetyltransferase [Anaerolineales bacterium]|uniref:GNAT family N-acetyltransferase n=1 Tax=Candidatus Desulfolinea nitratireducens TaxID=2841698 RepID=A0A8J6TE55_9CHLR|nr:GNAT family N-acetyltransferase [Candidatus Desulfolinea nitratireducens]MBL6960187.1 GNAT family N-acetyltransferase [Anaerolineales bacterium]
MKIEPVILEGNTYRLEPLSEAHISALTLAGSYESIWQHMRYGMVTTEEKMRAWVLDMLARQEREGDLPFAVCHLQSEQAIGATRFMNIDHPERGLEIGGTWYTPSFQGSGVNTEAKYLLLKYAFEELGCIRVQIKTDIRNIKSQRSIERLGAVREGMLRNHVIRQDGSYRDSVFYSIIESEWTEIKYRLEELLLNRDGDRKASD